jgi:VanZ family protein
MGWMGIVAITIASLVPGSLRPHAGLPGPIEHALAYCLIGTLLCVGYVTPRERLFFWIGLAACSALFEILQNFVPGRSLAVIDSLASIAGLTAGFASGAAIQTFFRFGRG